MGDGRIGLVTGAGKGIGAAIAVELAEMGFDVWINYRSDHEAAGRVAEEVERRGANATLIPFDVSDGEATEAALSPLLDEHRIYALVNNAGYARDTLLAMMSEDEWKGVLSVHLDGFYRVTKLALPGMLRQRSGRIVNIVSTSGQGGVAGQVNYSAAKAGLIGATKALALEVAKRNILVNAVSPGFIETDMTSEVPREKVLPMIPMGRFGTPEEVSSIVGFLCSGRASYITGQLFAVNGGVYT